MNHVRVNAKVMTDKTGVKTEIPVILYEHDGRLIEIESLVDYLLANSQGRSLSWMQKLCQGVELLLDYMLAGQQLYDKPAEVFETFAQRIHTGTIGDDGMDPSWLYWLPKHNDNANQLLTLLSNYSDWMVARQKYNTTTMNPWREATTHEQRLNWAAFIHRNKRSFLGHTADYADAAEAAKQARNVMLRKSPVGTHGGTKAFPEDNYWELLFEGFKVRGKENADIVDRYDWGGICITHLQHHGALRVSECFHLWVHDVQPDPEDPSIAVVRVFDPIHGAAPKDRRGPDRRYLPNREAYLRMFYPGYRPRNMVTGNQRAGWKHPQMTDVQNNFMYVFWSTKEMGRFFMRAWQYYMQKRFREKIGTDKHPFAFVSFRGEAHGEPYTIDSYRDRHNRAVRHIGLNPRKENGTTEHGHRHASGQRLSRAKVSKLIIQAVMHHKSPESQDVYTQPQIAQVTEEMARACEALEAGLKPPPDIDRLNDSVQAGKKLYLLKGDE